MLRKLKFEKSVATNLHRAIRLSIAYKIMKGSMRRKAMAKLNRIRPEEFASQICDVYVSGISTRKVKKSLKSATGAKIKLSKSTVSRITKKLVTEFQEWKKKDSSKLGVAYLFFDAIRVGKRSGLFSFNLSSL